MHGVVYRCARCGVTFLPPVIEDLKDYYQSGVYREDVGESPDAAEFFKLHDTEQLGKYGLLKGLPLRGKVIADVGCAGGSFLDGVRGFASVTIGIEPTVAYHDSLQQRGHIVYPDMTNALLEWRGRVHLVVCFSVIEHVEQPVGLLRDIRTLLAEGGCLLLSTPNQRDILLELGCEAYRGFFYRTAHVHYFDEISLRTAANAAGISSLEAKYIHRFNYANFIGWLRDKKPTGNKGQTVLGTAFDRRWQAVLEERGLADYLYAYMYVQR